MKHFDEMTTPEERLTEKQRLKAIAAILARGVHRYHKRLQRDKTSESNPKDLAKGLEVPGETRLSVSRVSC